MDETPVDSIAILRDKYGCLNFGQLNLNFNNLVKFNLEAIKLIKLIVFWLKIKQDVILFLLEQTHICNLWTYVYMVRLNI